MKFIVDRKTWYRGQGSLTSELLRPDGSRCCIGFVGQQCGVPDASMLERSAIDQGAGDWLQGFPEWMDAALKHVSHAYAVNDNPDISDQVREAKLKAIFAEHGDEIEFVGEGKP